MPLLAVVTLGTAFVSPSQAHEPLAGNKCAFNSSTDVTREAGWQIGHIRGGPLVTGENGTLVCEIHVNNNTHDGAAVFTTSYTATGGAVVVGEPRVLNYPATAADTVSLCSEWHGEHGTYYWRGGNTTTGDLGAWSTSPTSCGEALSIEPNWPTCPIWLAIDQRAGTNIAEIWQDCEPYEPII